VMDDKVLGILIAGLVVESLFPLGFVALLSDWYY
jgi:hypothetical protein